MDLINDSKLFNQMLKSKAEREAPSFPSLPSVQKYFYRSKRR